MDIEAAARGERQRPRKEFYQTRRIRDLLS